MILTALSMLLAAADPAVDIRCTFERVDATTVAVTVSAPVDPDGTTEWLLPPNWAGSPDPIATIADPVATAGDGSPLLVERVRGAGAATRDGAPPDDVLWRVRAPSGSMSLRYLLHSAAPKSEGRVGNDYGTIVEDDLFRLHGPLGLVLPSTAGADEPIRATVAWKNFDRDGMRAVSSLGRGDRTTTTTRESLQAGLFMAGRIITAEQPVPGGMLCVAVHGPWSFSAEEFAVFVAPIIRAERDFFADTSEPFFLVTLQSNRAAPTSGGFSLGGTACTNAFALYCMSSMSLDARSPHALEVKKLLAHEYFHTWNGHVLGTSGPEGSAYWFSEGFTDHFARRIMRSAGLINDAEYTEILNQQVGRYMESPLRGARNDVIVERFWTDRAASELPYLRGDLIATLVNEEILRKSNGSRSIDDVMRTFVTRARDERWRPDSEALLAALTEATSPAWGTFLRAAIVDGTPIELPRTLTSPLRLSLTEAISQSFDPGFDVDASRASGVVTGLHEGSGAAKAGLREGMKLKGFSIEPSTSGGPPKGFVAAFDGAQVREFSYEAVSAPQRRPSYRPSLPAGQKPPGT